MANTKAPLKTKATWGKDNKEVNSNKIRHSVYFPGKPHVEQTAHSHALSCSLSQLNIKLRTYTE